MKEIIVKAEKMPVTVPENESMEFNCPEGDYSTFMKELRCKLAEHKERDCREHLELVARHDFLHEHPLLPSQRPKKPARWIKIRLVGNNKEETTLLIRDDNVYLIAFKAQNGVCYEFGLSAVHEKKKKKKTMTAPLIPGSTFLECHEDYKSILGCDGAWCFPKLKLGERQLQLGKEFAVEAVHLLSNYNKEKIDDDTKNALAGLIFMFCESARMYPHHNEVELHWDQGDYTVQIKEVEFMRNWGNMSRFLMDWMANPQIEEAKLQAIGITNKRDALGVVHLVLHSPLRRTPKHQSQQQQSPSSEDQDGPPGGPGERGTQHQNPLPSPTQNGRGHKQQPPPAGGHGRGHEQQPPPAGGHGRGHEQQPPPAGGHGRRHEQQPPPAGGQGGPRMPGGPGENGTQHQNPPPSPTNNGRPNEQQPPPAGGHVDRRHEQQLPSSEGHGQTLVEVFAVRANFPVVGTIAVFDGKCGQVIYEHGREYDHLEVIYEHGREYDHLEVIDNHTEFEDLILSGPYRAISAEGGSIAIEVDLSPPAGSDDGSDDAEANGADLWKLEYNADEADSLIRATISVNDDDDDDDDKEIQVAYAMLSNAVEAKVEVKLWFVDGTSDSIEFHGHITAQSELFRDSKDARVLLFSGGEAVTSGSMVSLERSVVAAPLGSKLLINVNLKADGNALSLNGTFVFSLLEQDTKEMEMNGMVVKVKITLPDIYTPMEEEIDTTPQEGATGSYPAPAPTTTLEIDTGLSEGSTGSYHASAPTTTSEIDRTRPERAAGCPAPSPTMSSDQSYLEEMENRIVRRAVRMPRTVPEDVNIGFNCREGDYSTFMNELRRILAAHQERNSRDHLELVARHPFLPEHPLLPCQRPQLPARWINIRLVGNNGEETTLRIRDDSVCLRGFKAQNGKWYEFGLSADKKNNNKKSVGLIPGSTFLECYEDYESILGCDGAWCFPKLKLGKEFAIEAVHLLSNYNKEVIDDDTKKTLAGLIFMFCESARMFPCYRKMKEHWDQGGYTVQNSDVEFILNWGNMSRLLMDNFQSEAADLREIGIRNKKRDALRVVHLVLHSPLGWSTKHQSQCAGPQQQQQQRRHEQQPPWSEGHGRALVEVFAVRANFRVVGTIAVFDGKHGQVIYEQGREYALLDNRTQFEDLVLTGPYRAISAEGGSIAIEVDLSPPAGSDNESIHAEANGASLWKLEYKAEEADSLIQATISLDDDKEIQVVYAVLSSAMEAKVQVFVEGASDGIKFYGDITAHSKLFRDRVLLFSGEAVTSSVSMVPLKRSVVMAPLCSKFMINVNLKAACPPDDENDDSLEGSLDFSLLEQDTKEMEMNGMMVRVKITLPDIYTMAEEIDMTLPEGATGSYPTPAPTTTSEIDIMLPEEATGSYPTPAPTTTSEIDIMLPEGSTGSYPAPEPTTTSDRSYLEEISSALSEGIGFAADNILTDSEESHKVKMEAVGNILTGALQALLPKLDSMLADQYNLQKGAKKGIRYIREQLESMQIALEKLSDVPPDQLDKQVTLWARKVRIMSYEIEDTVDSYMLTVNPSAAADQPESSTIISAIRSMLSRAFKARHDIATEIEHIRKEVKEVAMRRRMYKIDDIATPPKSSDSHLSAIYQDETELVGIDHSTEQIMELLSTKLDQAAGTSTSSDKEKKMLSLVAIVGPAGMDRTTLANVVYQKLTDDFDCTAFVSVSLKPNIKNILGSILHQVDKDRSILRQESHRNHGNADNWSQKEIIDKIRRVLANKRYLIVIDDIWDELTWKRLKCVLVPNRLGSKIITTTGNVDIAKLCCSCDNVDGTIHQLKPLSEVESEELFYYKIFGGDKCPPELKDISRKILVKCKGWPLYITAIANLLANKRKQTEEQWVRVYFSMGGGLENAHDVNGMWLISLSYSDMSSQLRACLLYLSMFSRDRIIERDDLIWRWIAEGFVHGKQDDKNISLYELGDAYFNELITRNMIRPADMDTTGRPQACIVHDVVLEFINFLSAKEGFITVLNGWQPFLYERDNIYRLSVQSSYQDLYLRKEMNKLRHVRTLFLSSWAATSMPSLSIFPVLRVLDLENCTSHNIKDVGILVFLRYLKLSQVYYDSNHIELPQEIGALQFLEILDLKDTRIQTLPETFVQLTHLRVLKLSLSSWDKRHEKHLIECLCNLKKLETLCIAVDADVSMDFMLIVEWAPMYLRRFTARLCEHSGHILRTGSVWRELSSFSKLPRWINSSLSSLSYLSIIVKKLQQQDVEILAQFPNLVTLDLEVVQASEEGRLVISGDERAFQCLSNLKFASRAMGLLFTPGAMQKLQNLYLCFSLARTKDVHDLKDRDFHFGLENLTSLKTVKVEIDCRCAWRWELEAVEAALRTIAKSNKTQMEKKSNKNKTTFDLRKHFEREIMSEAVFSKHEGSSRGMAEEKLAGLSRIGPYGGNGGKSYDFPVPLAHHLRTITIRSGDAIDSLAFSYSNHNGQQRNAGPWGGSGGGASTFHLGPSEYLTQVSGTTSSFWGINNVVRSLTFVTNIKSYGPYGKDNGQNQFVVQARRNNRIVGFFGKAGDLIDSVGFYTRSL